MKTKIILLSENLHLFHPKIKGTLETNGNRVIQLIHDNPEAHKKIDGIVIYHDHYMTSMLLISLKATSVVLLTGRKIAEAQEFHQSQCAAYPHHRINTIAFNDANKSADRIAEKVAFLLSEDNRNINHQIIKIR